MSFDLETFQYLPLLLIVPAFWWLGRSLRHAIGYRRAAAALSLRSMIIVGLVLALSGIQWGWFTKQIAVVYLLDQSDSISAESKRAMIRYAVDSVDRNRHFDRRDLAGLVVFAGESRIEVPPFEESLPADLRPSLSDIRVDATNVEGAIDLAIAAMPPEARQRIVLITDGNETSGNAKRAAEHAINRGVGIDIVPILADNSGDVSLDRFDIPNRIDAGQPFAGRLIVSYQGAGDDEVIRGQVTITQSSHGEEQLVLRQAVELSKGKTVLPFQHRLVSPAAYSFEATFVPEDAAMDQQGKNNRIGGFARVGGLSRTLLIEPFDQTGQLESLAKCLRDERIDVDIRASDSAFSSLADLLAYDSVILVNLPRAGGDSTETIVGLSDSQVETLIRNTDQFGAGLLMIGGPDAFGPGGWGGTKLEAAMPVDFDIQNSRIRAVGALALVLDTSGSMSGQKLALSKSAASQAIASLGVADFAGVISFDSETREIIPLQQVGDPRRMMPALSRIGADGGTVMYPAMSLGYSQLAGIDAMVKHMIVVTDGRTQADAFEDLTRRMRSDGITVSTLAIGDDADLPLLRKISSLGGGNFNLVVSPLAIPKIVLRESRRVSKLLIFEQPDGITPQQVFPHAVMEGIHDCPPVTGFVLTTPKESPLVQNVLMSPRPGDFDHPVLSVWTYGLGRTAVLTTDAGHRWADSWSQWSDQNKFFGQLVRWLKRPDGGSDAFHVTSRWSDGEVSVVVDAVEKGDNLLELLDMQGVVVGPTLKTKRMELRKVAPGRFVGTLPLNEPGSHFIQVLPNLGAAPIISGVTVPFGLEYRAAETNLARLQSLARLRPTDAEAGVLSKPLDTMTTERDFPNHFRPGLPDRAVMHTAWPWLVLASCLIFLGDVGNRRVAFRLSSLGRRYFKRGSPSASDIARLDRMDQLSQAKSALSPERSTIEPSLGTARSSPDGVTDRSKSDGTDRRPESPRDEPTETGVPAGSRPYVERLLAAKRRAKTGNADPHDPSMRKSEVDGESI